MKVGVVMGVETTPRAESHRSVHRGLVVPARVDGQVAEELAGGGVDVADARYSCLS
jgi:hypothetical protein